MRHFVDPDSKPSEKDVTAALKDFQPYHPTDLLFRMYAEYSNHGNYGYAGGVLDQPDIYWHDMSLMRWVEIWVKDIAPLAATHEVHKFQDAIQKLKQGGTM